MFLVATRSKILRKSNWIVQVKIKEILWDQHKWITSCWMHKLIFNTCCLILSSSSQHCQKLVSQSSRLVSPLSHALCAAQAFGGGFLHQKNTGARRRRWWCWVLEWCWKWMFHLQILRWFIFKCFWHRGLIMVYLLQRQSTSHFFGRFKKHVKEQLDYPPKGIAKVSWAQRATIRFNSRW